MNHENLSKRLQTVANFVPKGAILADVGSDHAYLPCYLAKKNYIKHAVAGEVVKGPFQSAQKHVQQLSLTSKIDVRLADGLMAIHDNDNVDTITICGMGGDLITSILNTGYQHHKLQGVSTLILQPNVDTHVIREWLMQHQFAITHETIIEENKKIYDIIVANSSDTPVYYTKDEIMFGIFLPREQSPVFIKKWEKEIAKYENVINSLKKSTSNESEKIEAFQQKINKIKEVIYGTC